MATVDRALVTGASTGLGRVIALRLARDGAAIGMVAREAKRLGETAAEVRAAGGRPVELPCDVTDAAAVATMAARALEQLGGAPQLLVNNAAQMVMGPPLDITPAQFNGALLTNAGAAFAVTRALLPAMIAAGGGTVIMVGATAGHVANPMFAAFAASKFALRALAGSFARAFKEDGIHVVDLVLDGAIDIPKMRRFLPGGDPARWLDPEAIADAIVYLHGQDRRAWTHELWLRPNLDRWI
jgi:NAD(P)-dependent dehydrogenase (short-subunit alcohol dehydrogenase family)